MASLADPSIWMCHCRPDGGRLCRWRLRGTRFAYVLRQREVLQRFRTPRGAHGAGGLGGHQASRRGGQRSLVLFDRGDELMVQAGDNGIRFLLVSGKPLEEPVAWYGRS